MGRTTLLLALLLSGCDALSPSSQPVGANAVNPDDFRYFIDQRTSLCFAILEYQRTDSWFKLSGGLSLTNVPCNERVRSLAAARKERG